MHQFALALGLTLATVMACAPEPADLDIGMNPPPDGGTGKEQEGGTRILSDVTLPPLPDSNARGVADGMDPRDATDVDRADRSVGGDAEGTIDVVPDMRVRTDAEDEASETTTDARNTRVDVAGGDAFGTGDAPGARDAAGTMDANEPDVDASPPLENCAAVRACLRSPGQTEGGCLREASTAARTSAEPLLQCETEACSRPCRSAYVLTECNACLLAACPSLLVACARQSGCGDGLVMADTEECDDGNVDDHDTCTTACTRARCGDGIVYDGQEECDDGNRVDTDACRISCRNAVCGDGVVWTGVEGCDDGNPTGGDGCSATCLIESCGNGIVDPGEECDDAVANRDEAPCLPTCRANRCGDGKTCRADGCGARLGTVLEQCDDGNDANTDACVKGCKSAVCGDGYVREGVETCDDGNVDPFDRCGHCAPAAGHLLITEVVTRPAAAEFVEIFNPTGYAVALSDYLLSDSHLYYEVAAGTFTTGGGSDFAARFPDGAELLPGHYAVIALGNASGGTQSFTGTYGRPPDYELRPTANQAVDDPAVPNMVAVAGTSIGASASLTDAGEPVVLFSYRGGDLVADVDYLFYGTPSASNAMIDKTGVVANASAYLADTPASAQHPVAAPGDGGSIHRCVYAESHETAAHGNGIDGHDETSEDAAIAFSLGTTAAARSPGAAPPAGICP